MNQICEKCMPMLNENDKALFEIVILMEDVTEELVSTIVDKINLLLKNAPEYESKILDLYRLTRERDKDKKVFFSIFSQVNIDFEHYYIYPESLVNSLLDDEKDLGKPLFHSIITDNLSEWNKLMIDYDKPEYLVFDKVSKYGSEKIWKTIILNHPEILQKGHYFSYIVASGNINLIRMYDKNINAAKIALKYLRPQLAYWFLNNWDCKIPSFKSIYQCFALNVMCLLSHPPSVHYYIKSLREETSCFAKMNLKNSSISMSFINEMHYKNKECAEIAMDHHATVGKRDLLHALNDRNVELANYLIDKGADVKYEENVPVAALAYDLDRSLYERVVALGASLDNLFMKSVLEILPGEVISDDFDAPESLAIFLLRHAKPENILVFGGSVKRKLNLYSTPDPLINPKMKAFETPYYSGGRGHKQIMVHYICYLDQRDLELTRLEMPKQPVELRSDYYNVVLLLSPRTIGTAWKSMDRFIGPIREPENQIKMRTTKEYMPVVRLILFFNSDEDLDALISAEKLARELGCMIFEINDEVTQELLEEVIDQSMETRGILAS